MHDDPIDLLLEWWRYAAEKTPMHDAAALATVGGDGRPAVRMVLVKQIDRDGLVFFTDRSSRKGRDISANPRVALCVHWKPLERQVRVEGIASATDDATSDAYWNTRPLGSRLSAQVSHQSSPLDDYAELEARRKALEDRFPDGEVPRPFRWGGYRVVPDRIELWKGHRFRLHERRVWTRADAESAWSLERLQP